MLASPELFRSWSSSSASTRASSGRSAGAVGSRPGGTAPGGSSGPSAPSPLPVEAGRNRIPGGSARHDGRRFGCRRGLHDGIGRRHGFGRRVRAGPVGLGAVPRPNGRQHGLRARAGTASGPDGEGTAASRARRQPVSARAAVLERRLRLTTGAAAMTGGPRAWTPAARARGARGRGRRLRAAQVPVRRPERAGCARAWILAMSPRAVGTPLPELTASRMRASSSSALCASEKARSSGAMMPLSICMKSVSSSWDRSPMGISPAIRAPPLSVCNGRLSASRPSTLLRFSFHCASAFCAASMSSTASSVKMLAMS